MQIIDNVAATEAQFPHVVLTLGSFDGVHLGHQRVLDALVRAARDRSGAAAVLTMTPHPREFFSPGHAPNLLTCDRKKARLLEQAGVDVLFFLEFDAETAGLDRAAFVEAIILQRCHAEPLIVGHDFCFGRGARRDFEFLQQMARRRRVSSTVIREAILQGDLERAEAFLGRPHSVLGRVVPGRGVGVELGYPTANVEPRHSAVPAQGVYVAEALFGGQRHPAAVNIGIAPTVRQEDIVIEAHLIDFAGQVVGDEIEIAFHKRLRSERKFPTHEALSRQIAQDVADVRAYFSTR